LKTDIPKALPQMNTPPAERVVSGSPQDGGVEFFSHPIGVRFEKPW
jgi:hypothetical protein